MKKLIAAFTLLFLIIGTFSFVGNVRALQKNFTATISPLNVYTGQSARFSLTINNVALNSGNKLGSAIVLIPSTFGLIQTPPISVISVPSGKNWEAVTVSGQIKITAVSSADCIGPGQSIVVSFSGQFSQEGISTPKTFTWATQAFTNPSWSGDIFALSNASPSTTVWLGFKVSFGYSDQDSSQIPAGKKIGSYTQFGVSKDITSGSSYGTTIPTSDWVDAGNNKLSYQTYSDTSGTQRWALSNSPHTINVQSSTTISESGYFHQFQVTFGYTVSDGSPSNPIAYYNQFDAAKTITAKQVAPNSDWVDANTTVTYDNPIADTNGFIWIIPEGETPKATVISPIDSAISLNPVYVLESPVGLVFPAGFDPGTIEIMSSNNAVDLGLYSLGDVIGPYFDVEIANNQLTGMVTISIHYYPPSTMTEEQERNLRLYMSDPVDLNSDGTVNGNDVNIMQSAIHDNLDAISYPQLDINGDGIIDSADLSIVKEFANDGVLVPSSSGGQWRLPWIDITTGIDIENNIIYGETDHFSGFGIRGL